MSAGTLGGIIGRYVGAGLVIFQVFHSSNDFLGQHWFRVNDSYLYYWTVSRLESRFEPV